jgi:hypothetical protein
LNPKDLKRIEEALAELGIVVTSQFERGLSKETVRDIIEGLSDDFASRMIELGYDESLRHTFSIYYEYRAFPILPYSYAVTEDDEEIDPRTGHPIPRTRPLPPYRMARPTITPSEVVEKLEASKAFPTDFRLDEATVAAMEEQRQIITDFIYRDPTAPTRRDRFITTVAAYMKAGLAPAGILAKATKDRPEEAAGWLASVWDAQPDLEQTYRQAGVFKNFNTFVNDTQVVFAADNDPNVLVRSYKAFTTIAAEVGTLLSPAFMSAITDNGGEMERAYHRVLAHHDVRRERGDLSEDEIADDLQRMKNAFDSVIGKTGDIIKAKQAALRSADESARTIQKRSDLAAIADQKEAFLNKEFSDIVQTIEDWADDNNLDMDAEQIDFLSRKMRDYKEKFDIHGTDRPIGPRAVLDSYFREVTDAIEATKRKSEIEELLKPFSKPNDIISDYETTHGVTFDERQKLAIRDYFLDLANNFDVNAGIDPPDPMTAISDFLEGASPFGVAGLQDVQKAQTLAETERAEREGFTLANLQQVLRRDLNLTMTPEDQRATLIRIGDIGIGAALAEVQQNAQRFANRAEAQDAQVNPSSFIRKILIDRGIITPDSGTAFLENLESTVIGPLSRSLSIGFASDPDLAGDHLRDFINTRIGGFRPTSLSEEAFARSKGFDFPGAPDLDAITGLPIRRPLPETDPTAFRSLIQELDQPSATPAFLSFLIDQEPELAAQFAETQRPRIDENLYDTRLRGLMDIQKQQQALATPPETDAVFPGAAVPSSRVSAALQSPLRTASLERLRRIARQGSAITPPTTQEFFTGKLPGLQSQFASSGPQIVKRAQVRAEQAEAATATRKAEETQASLRRRRAPLSVFRKGRA